MSVVERVRAARRRTWPPRWPRRGPEPSTSPPLASARFRRRRWRGRLGRWRAVLLAVLAVAVLGGGSWVVLGSSLLVVDEVRVEGASVLSPHVVEEAAAIAEGTPLARVDPDAVAGRVRTLRPVAAVEVHRDWPGTVRIVVTEREAIAVLTETAAGDVVRGLDVNGVLFRTFRVAPADLPLIHADELPAAAASSGAGSVRADALREVAAVVGSLERAVARRVEYVEVESLDAIVLVLHDGATVQWGSAEDSALKGEVLAALMRVPASTYDVSVPQMPTTSG